MNDITQLKVFHFSSERSQSLISVIRYSLIILLILPVQCTENSKQKIINSDPGKAIVKSDTLLNKPVAVSASLSGAPGQPITVNSDTCPKPLTIAVPKAKGGSYIIYYETGPEKIPLLPPAVTFLPLSKVFSTGSTISNPEAQGEGFFTTYTSDNGLALDGITSSIRDKTGNLWFGTDVDGLSCYDGKSVTNYTISQGLANNTVWSIAEDNSENLWFGTNGAGILSTDRGMSICQV